MTPFKIGSIYRQNNGTLIRLDATAFGAELSPGRPIHAPAGIAFATILRGGVPCGNNGHRRLCDGRYPGHDYPPTYVSHLIPGELNAQGEPIAPTFYCAAETIKPAEKELSEWDAEDGYKRDDEAWREWEKLKAEIDSAEQHPPALTWADSKAADPFRDFKVTRDTAIPDHAYSHPLTRVADAGAQTNPKSGSAYLVEVHDAKSIFRAQI